MKNSVHHILLADITVLRITLGVGALLFSFGLLFASSGYGAYVLMLKQAPAHVWALAFAVYAFFKFLLAVREVHRGVVYSVVLMGVYLWLFTLVSFIENPERPLGSADLMLLYMVIAEVWVGASTLSGARHD